MLLRCCLLHIGPIKEVILLVSGNRPGENFFISHSPAKTNVYHNIHFCVQKGTNKQQTNKNKKKTKETNEEKRISLENRSKKKKNCGRSSEDFSCHPHFLKQEKTI